jgi:hypothetical protein
MVAGLIEVGVLISATSYLSVPKDCCRTLGEKMTISDFLSSVDELRPANNPKSSYRRLNTS